MMIGHQAATDIKRVYRGYRVRSKKIPMLHDKYIVEAELSMKNDSATTIQTFYRAYSAAKKMNNQSYYNEFEENLWLEIQHNAASRIQMVARAFLARQKLREAILQNKRNQEKAMKDMFATRIREDMERNERKKTLSLLLLREKKFKLGCAWFM